MVILEHRGAKDELLAFSFFGEEHSQLIADVKTKLTNMGIRSFVDLEATPRVAEQIGLLARMRPSPHSNTHFCDYTTFASFCYAGFRVVLYTAIIQYLHICAMSAFRVVCYFVW